MYTKNIYEFLDFNKIIVPKAQQSRIVI